MSATLTESGQVARGNLQLATFYIDDMLLGLQIDQVQEINRRLDLTLVPESVESVRGVLNLRGEVVTIIDLRSVFGMSPAEVTPQSRNLIVNCKGELIGLWVDRIADIVTVSPDDIIATPTNVSEVDSRYFKGVVPMKTEILVVLNLATVLEID